MYTSIKNGSDSISIQLVLVYCKMFSQDFRYLSNFVSVRLMVLGGISVQVDKYPLLGQQLVRVYDCCKMG